METRCRPVLPTRGTERARPGPSLHRVRAAWALAAVVTFRQPTELGERSPSRISLWSAPAAERPRGLWNLVG